MHDIKSSSRRIAYRKILNNIKYIKYKKNKYIKYKNIK